MVKILKKNSNVENCVANLINPILPFFPLSLHILFSQSALFNSIILRFFKTFNDSDVSMIATN